MVQDFLPTPFSKTAQVKWAERARKSSGLASYQGLTNKMFRNGRQLML